MCLTCETREACQRVALLFGGLFAQQHGAAIEVVEELLRALQQKLLGERLLCFI